MSTAHTLSLDSMLTAINAGHTKRASTAKAEEDARAASMNKTIGECCEQISEWLLSKLFKEGNKVLHPPESGSQLFVLKIDDARLASYHPSWKRDKAIGLVRFVDAGYPKESLNQAMREKLRRNRWIDPSCKIQIQKFDATYEPEGYDYTGEPAKVVILISLSGKYQRKAKLDQAA